MRVLNRAAAFGVFFGRLGLYWLDATSCPTKRRHRYAQNGTRGCGKRPTDPIEYWFRRYDASVMLCEPFKTDGCDTITTTFDQDASGAIVQAGSGLQSLYIPLDPRQVR